MPCARGAWRRAAVALAALFATATAAGPAAAGSAALSASAPTGFDALERPQTTLVDVYVGGVRVTSTLARYTPSALTFLKPEEVAAAVPHLKRDARLREALAGELATHAGRACDGENVADCGRLSPEVVGVIFDEARFRADLFVNPAFLDVADPLTGRYLPAPAHALSAVAVAGGVVSGSAAGEVAYGLQSRAVVSYGSFRLTSEVSQSSGDGFRAETLAAAVDRGAMRYEAGLLWTPTLDFFGQGRIVGASVGTQLDTLENRDLVSATPLLVYLSQRARVELYRGQRLMAAGTYEAGNQLIDTSSLPDGAYEVTLHIREAGGAVREERRFFTRSRRLPPLGRPQFQLTVGALVDAAGSESGRGRPPVAQASYARRLSGGLAVDGAAGVIGGEPLVTAGASWLAGWAQVRAGATASGRGDYGLALDAALNLRSRLTVTFDVRQAWTARTAGWTAGEASGDPMTPAPLSRLGFSGAGLQATAGLNANVRDVLLALNGSINADRGSAAAYAVGGSVEAPIGRGPLQGMRLYASAAQTDRGAQVYVGLRFRLTHGRGAVFGEAGYAAGPRALGGGSNAVASVSASQEATTGLGEASLGAAYAHSGERDTVSGSAVLRGPGGDIGATLEQDLRGAGAETRYSASFALGAAFADGRASTGSAASGQNGVVVSVAAPKSAVFQVLVDDAPAARVASGAPVSLFLPAYRVYRVRLAPLGGDPLAFDTGERRVSLFPGNVARLQWSAEPELEVFGRVLDARGAPLRNAAIAGATTPTSTDANGWFQASVGAGRVLVFAATDGGSCRLSLDGLNTRAGYAALGTRTCPPSAEPLTIARR